MTGGQCERQMIAATLQYAKQDLDKCDKTVEDVYVASNNVAVRETGFR